MYTTLQIGQASLCRNCAILNYVSVTELYTSTVISASEKICLFCFLDSMPALFVIVIILSISSVVQKAVLVYMCTLLCQRDEWMCWFRNKYVIIKHVFVYLPCLDTPRHWLCRSLIYYRETKHCNVFSLHYIGLLQFQWKRFVLL
jgi:hypothetical protein